MTEAESPANPLGRSSAFTVTLPFLLSVSVPYSITLSHLVDDAFADLSHIAALIPAREIVVKEQLLFLIPYRTDDVLVHDVRDEELRQPLRVDHLLAGLFHILGKIRYRLAEHRAVVHSLEVGSAKPFVEVGVLNRRLHLLLDRRIVLDLNEFSGHRSVRNVEQSVEVKTLLFGRTLPHPNILPALAVAHHFEASAQFSHKTLFGMLCPVVGKSRYGNLWEYMSLFRLSEVVEMFVADKFVELAEKANAAGMTLNRTKTDRGNIMTVLSSDIQEYNFCNTETFAISGSETLETVKIGDHCFYRENRTDRMNCTFTIDNCRTLRTIYIGLHSFLSYSGGFELRELPELETLQIGKVGVGSDSFSYCNFVAKSNNLQWIYL